MLLQLVTIAFLLFAAAALLYQVALAAAALLRRRGAPALPQAPCHSFAILIPAHNEEAQLGATLSACRALDYPPELVRLYVIADNCTDGTAHIARAHGVRCLERHDLARRGKGPALAWALERILPAGPGAVIVLDADCTLDPHALRCFDRRLSAGADVLQACNVAANPDETAVSYVTSVANRIENYLFYAPKSAAGLAVLLRGTGMVFRRQVLTTCPWQADSVVEDAEHTVRLYQSGQRVTFVPEACVRSAFPAGRAQMQVQRTRWVGGNFALALRRALPLLAQGLRQRRFVLCDLGWTLLVAMRSLLLLQLLAACLLAALTAVLTPGRLSTALLAGAGGLVVVQGLYFLAGVLHLGVTRGRLEMLAQAPLVVARLLLIASASVLRGRLATWERTPR